jgi:hypothetical protein
MEAINFWEECCLTVLNTPFNFAPGVVVVWVVGIVKNANGGDCRYEANILNVD